MLKSREQAPTYLERPRFNHFPSFGEGLTFARDFSNLLAGLFRRYQTSLLLMKLPSNDHNTEDYKIMYALSVTYNTVDVIEMTSRRGRYKRVNPHENLNTLILG